MARELVEATLGSTTVIGAKRDIHGIGCFVRFCFDTSDAFIDDVAIRAALRLQAEHNLIELQLPNLFTDWMGAVTTMLQRARQIGEIHRTVDPEATAWLLVASLTGLHNASQRLARSADLHSRVAEWLRMSLRSLGCETADDIVERERKLRNQRRDASQLGPSEFLESKRQCEVARSG